MFWHTPQSPLDHYRSKYNNCRTPAMKNPVAFLNKLKLESKRMWKLNIVGPVSEPNQYVNPLTVVEKPNNKLRVWLDPKYLNQATSC